MMHVDIFADDAVKRASIRATLSAIHVSDEGTSEGFRVFGYLREG